MRCFHLLLPLALTACESRVDFTDKGEDDTASPDSDADTDADADTDTDADSDADTDTDTDADTDADTDTDTGTPPSVWDGVFSATTDGIGGPALATLMNISVLGDVVAAHGYGGYVWISTDGGLSWTSSYNSDLAYTADGLAVTDDGIFAASYAGIFRSVDGGATWTNESAGLGGAYAMVLATDGSALYAETTYGEQIFRWNGASWDEVTSPTAYSTPLVVSGDSLYTGDFGANVYASHDGGETWEQTAYGDGVDTLLQSALDEGELLGWDLMGGTLSRSTDGGYTWTDLPIPLNAEGFVQAGGNLYARIYLDGVKVSTDDGATWTSVNSGLPSGWGRWVQDLAVTADGGLLASPYQAGPYRFDGAVWSESADGIIAGTATDATMYDGKLITTWGTDFAWSYEAATDTWTGLDSPASGAAMLGRIGTNGEVMLVSSAYYGLYRSEDGGASWADANAGFPDIIGDAGLEALYVYDLAFRGDTVLAAHSIAYEGSHEGTRTPTGGGVSVSTDAGESWSWSPRGLPVVASDDNGQPVYPSGSAVLATDDAFLFAAVGQGMYRSVDDGGFWEAATGIDASTLVTDMVRVGDFVYASGQDVNTPMDTAGNGLWRSADDGVTWAPEETGLPTDARVAALATTGTSVFALVTAPTQGIWRFDAGTWTEVVTADAAGGATLQAPLVLEGDDFYVATAGAGILRLVPVE